MPVPDPELGPVPPPGAYFRHEHQILALLYLVKRVMGFKESWQAMGLPLYLCYMR